MRIRPATLADAEELAETVQEGFESYREWAPAGWDPPERELHLVGIRERLPREDCWCTLAVDREAVAGQAAFLAAPDPGTAHIWMLFLRRPWWGTGLAQRLLAEAAAAARERGHARMRLHTPLAHARARAFYEREGWTATGDVRYEPMLGLELVEYGRELA
jgi:GNAT superfamily N-acetyltransferase